MKSSSFDQPAPPKVIDVPMDGPPLSFMPSLTHEIAGQHMRAVLLPPGEVSCFLRSDCTTIDINLNAVTHLASWNSDRLIRSDAPADSIAFIPADGDWRIVSENYLPGVVFEFSQDYLAEQLTCLYPGAGTAAALDFRDYEHDPASAMMGRAAMGILRESRGAQSSLVLESIGLSILNRAITLLRSERDGRANPDADKPLSAGKLRAVTEYIEARLDQPLTVSELAQIAGLSASHFAKAFNAAEGTSPGRYVTVRRITRAKDLLAETDLALAEIAAMCGFSDQSHLGRVFRRQVGMTPGAYRKSCLF